MNVAAAVKRVLRWPGHTPTAPAGPPPRTEMVEVNGELWRIHAAWQCLDGPDPCVFHSPSDHKMRSWPMHLRETGLVERICEDNGIGHPDPDSAAYFSRVGPEGSRDSWGIHGCDGCCGD